MTKADLVEVIHDHLSFSKKEAAELVELVFHTIKSTLEHGEQVKVSGFGKFEVRGKRSRVGRNPQTGDAIRISARRVVTFKPSQLLKQALNARLAAQAKTNPK
jgi:integration host factor subunit alpha